jgi:D-beta-D-heptose 7-phosphate kinase / D-beta-D-heptose 1-phosphate adenosyltransferase
MNEGALVVVGDALLDRDVDGHVSGLAPDAPAPVLDGMVETRRPGGAALAALLAALEGLPVVLAAPLGDDPASMAVRTLLEPWLSVVPLPLRGALQEKTRFRADGRTLLRVDSAAGSAGPAGPEAADAIAGAGALLVADYGRGATADTGLRRSLAAQARRVPLVWDPHPRGTEPVPGTWIVTPNHREAFAAAGTAGRPLEGRLVGAAAGAARTLLRRWQCGAVAVTLGADGALLVSTGSPVPLIVPGAPVAAADTCGAGDRFAAAVVAALHGGALVSEAVTSATGAASEFLARGGVSQLPGPGESSARADQHGSPRSARGAAVTGAAARRGAGRALGRPADIAGRVRRAGGTVVATGGCFDVLHAGHVSMLTAARALGDCLIVCLNSDASVRRLKGAGRPLNTSADRAAVLSSLQCVDCVMVFEEDTPVAALRMLRPNLWVKGGDYNGQDLPEASLLRTWGGQAVTVPYLAGRSTTRLQAAAMALAEP